MEFLYPNMLYGLIALIIPIVVHLFNFRRHKLVYFSNTSILKTIEQETSKTKKLKYIITLIMRMLFIASIVVAFAFPYKKDNNTINNNVDNLIAIYIDNSMSMQSHSSEKTLFEDSRTSAMKLVENLNQAQKYVLLSNDRNPENEYPMNKDEMLQRLNEMKTEAPSTSIDDIYNSLAFIKKKNDFNSATLFVYSDFQNNTMTSDDFKVDTTIQIVAFPLKSDFQNNIYIDSVWLQSPVLQKNMTNELNARIVNETANDIKGLPVNFSIDENVVAYTTCDIKADSYADVNMQFVVENEGDSKAKVAINDSPITFDDEYNLVLKVRPEINVIEISSTAKSQKPMANSLSLLFDGDALINYQSINKYNIDQSVINNAQMIVVDNTELNETMQKSLIEFAERGGTLLMIESQSLSDSGTQRYNAYIYNCLGIKPIDFDDNETKLEYIAKRNSFFDDIFVELPDNADLPKVKKHIRFKIGKNVQNIISLQNGDPLLMMSNVGKGKIFVMSTSFDEEYSDLANHALFVPLMYKMALIGGNISELSYTLGVDKTLNINDISLNIDDRINLKSDNAMYEIFPMIENRNGTNYISFFEDLPSSGFYDIYKNEEYIKTVAWNDDRGESEMSFFNEEKLTEYFKNINLNLLATVDYEEMNNGNVVENIVNQSSLWRMFVIIALMALLIEILILRFWK